MSDLGTLGWKNNDILIFHKIEINQQQIGNNSKTK